ncbi:Uncharacterized protein Rs2_11118 [Raphanus sativus]|nr:Uncharacterized protein Rs2_11118 [Raphanus sativus]
MEIPSGGYVKFFGYETDEDQIEDENENENENEDEVEDAVAPQFGPFPTNDLAAFDFNGDQIRCVSGDESYVFPIKFAVTSGAFSYTVPDLPGNQHFTTDEQRLSFPYGGIVRIRNGNLFAHEPMEFEDENDGFISVPAGGYAQCFNNDYNVDPENKDYGA